MNIKNNSQKWGKCWHKKNNDELLGSIYKATGVDGITNKLIQYGGTYLIAEILMLKQKNVWSRENTPTNGKQDY